MDIHTFLQEVFSSPFLPTTKCLLKVTGEGWGTICLPYEFLVKLVIEKLSLDLPNSKINLNEPRTNNY